MRISLFGLRVEVLVLAAALSLVLGACGGRTSDADKSARDVGARDARVPDASRPDGAATSAPEPSSVPDAASGVPDAPDASPRCCPISDEPDCCMDYGGTYDGYCGTTCDGMPRPDADWQVAVNGDGCPYWVEPKPHSEFECCGCPQGPDGGVSEQPDAALDASSTAGDGAAADGGSADAGDASFRL